MPAYHFQRIEPKWQAYWERNKTFRTPRLRPRASPSSTSSTCSPTPAARACTSATPRGTRRPTSSAATSGCAASTSSTRWAGTPSACPPSSTPSRPAPTPARRPRRTSPPSSGRSSRWGSPTTGTARSTPPTPAYYKWTQWIFLQLFDTWYDPDFAWVDPQGVARKGKGRPIAELPIPAGRPTPTPIATRSGWPTAPRSRSTGAPRWGRCWPTRRSSTARASAAAIPVVRMPLKQWMLRITAYAERLIDDLEGLDWSRAIKDMQRNWIGRSEGAEVDFPFDDPGTHPCSRPDPDAGLVRDAPARRDPRLHHAARHALRRDLHGPRPRAPARRSPDHARAARGGRRVSRRPRRPRATWTAPTWRRPRPASSPADTPSTRSTASEVPVWVADYVLMGYGTGAIMAVPGHDERDFEFAQVFGLPIVRVVAAVDRRRRRSRWTRPRPRRAWR